MSQSIVSPNPEAYLKAFGTYDIRGIVGETLDEASYLHMGHCFAQWLKQQPDAVNKDSLCVAVGYDARLHSPKLFEALVKGLCESGILVLDLGMKPTPLVYFTEHAIQKGRLSAFPAPTATLTVTASHNPAPYNGLKFTYLTKSFTQAQLAEFKQLCHANENNQPRTDIPAGKRIPIDILPVYLDYIQEITPHAKAPVKLVMDCGNGTAGVAARQTLETLGFEPIMLFEAPDGHFPNHHPDPCVHANLQDLARKVRETGADLGVAFDGDSDRLGVVDETGRIIPGDLILVMYAEALLQNAERQHTVVSEVKCTQTLFDRITALGGKAIMSPTGHAFIKQRMAQEDASLGGELSGHFFFRDVHYGFDDAFYAAARLVSIVSAAKVSQPGLKLSGLLSHLPQSIMSEEERIACPKDLAPAVLQSFRQLVEENPSRFGLPFEAITQIDGIRVNFTGGFLLVRKSNTEPCLTTRYEAADKAGFEQLGNVLAHVLTQALAQNNLSYSLTSH